MSKDECPSCGNKAIRIDVVMVSSGMGDYIDGIPEEAEDMCMAMHGIHTSTPVGGAIIAWHDEEVGKDG